MFTSGYNACSDKIKSANEACKSAFDNIPRNPLSGRRKRKRDIEDITEGRPEHEHFFASLKTYRDDHNDRTKPTMSKKGNYVEFHWLEICRVLLKCKAASDWLKIWAILFQSLKI